MTAIVRGRLPDPLSLKRLKKGFPLEWATQPEALGFPPKSTPYPDPELAKIAFENWLECGRECAGSGSAFEPGIRAGMSLSHGKSRTMWLLG